MKASIHMLLKKLKMIAKSTLLDPGFGLGVCGTFLFAGGNPVGVAGCMITTALIAGAKVLQIVNPAFMQQNAYLPRLIKDSRTPLRLLGLAMLTVLGATLVQNATDLWTVSSSAAEFVSKGWLTIILPSIASASFAMANFRFAATTSVGSEIKQESAAPLTPKHIAKLIALRPETYLSIAQIALGLVSGGASLLAVPFIASGFGLTLKNVLQNRPVYTGHPNMYFIGMTGVLAAVGFAAGNPLIGIGYIINTACLARITSMTTPGGLNRVYQDAKESLQSLSASMLDRKSLPPLAGEPQLAPQDIYPAAPLCSTTKSLTASFTAPDAPKQRSSSETEIARIIKLWK